MNEERKKANPPTPPFMKGGIGSSPPFAKGGLGGIFLAVLSGVLVTFSFPTVLFGWHAPDMGIIGWVALVPLFMAIHKAEFRKTFLLTFLSASIWYGGSLYWIYHAVHYYGRVPAFGSVLITTLLVVIISCYIALAPSLANFIARRTGQERIVWLAVLWTALEFCRNYFPCNGFPWSNIAMSQYGQHIPLQIVDLVGIYGLMFAMVWSNQFISELILAGSNQIKGKILISAVLFVFILVYGVVRPHGISNKGLEPMMIAMIQGNIPQEDKWSEEKAKNNLNIYKTEASKLRRAPIDLIIWPEASYPWPISTKADSIDPALFAGANTLLGALGEEPAGEYHNSAFLFDPFGKLKGQYHKTHLVPLGEYVPYKKILSFARKLAAPIGDFAAGTSFEPLTFVGRHIGVLICYEDIFPEISRKIVLNGAGFLANLTNDAWYGISSAPYQHLALSVFRAVENRRWLVRSTNTGVTSIIDPTGKIVMESPIFERSLMVSSIFPMTALSPYTRFGDWFALACLAYGIFGLIMATIRRR